MDWNDQKYGEIWRQGWADTANRYLEAIDSPERLDLRSYARQGIDKIPTDLREKELSTVQSLDAYLDTVSGQAVSIRAEMKPKEQRMKKSTPCFPISPTLKPISRFM